MKEKLATIINTYGIRPQLKHFNSEVFELNEAIIDAEHYKNLSINDKMNNYCLEHIAEEIADNMVILGQFQIFYGIKDEDIKKIMEQKIDRQLGRMSKE